MNNPTHRIITTSLLQAASSPASNLDTFNEALPKTPALNPTSQPPFDSSMALTIIVLLSALFFLGFFSVYIRRFASSSASSSSPTPQPPSVRRFTTNRKGGLDSAAVEALPVVAYSKAAKHTIMMMEDCPICLSEFEERESVKVIPYCGHVFHPRCVDTWLASHVTCPLCRSDQLMSKEVVSDEVCLDVIEIGEGSTAQSGDTCRMGGCSGDVASVPNPNPVVLHRSMH